MRSLRWAVIVFRILSAAAPHFHTINFCLLYCTTQKTYGDIPTEETVQDASLEELTETSDDITEVLPEEGLETSDAPMELSESEWEQLVENTSDRESLERLREDVLDGKIVIDQQDEESGGIMHCQSFGRRIHARHSAFRLDGSLGEHIRLAFQIAVLIHIFQRTQEIVGGIVSIRCLPPHF